MSDKDQDLDDLLDLPDDQPEKPADPVSEPIDLAALGRLSQPQEPDDQADQPSVARLPTRLPDSQIRDRQRRVMIMYHAGVPIEDIADELRQEQAERLAGKDYRPVSFDTIVKDLKKIERELEKKANNLNSTYEIGKALAQLEVLYEQAQQDYYKAPGSSPQRAKFLELSRNLIETRIKFLQSVGSVTKVADKTEIEHQNAITSQLTKEQKQFLARQLLEMSYQQHGHKPGKAMPAPAEGGLVLDAEVLSEALKTNNTH